MIDDEDLDGRFRKLELQPQLLLHRGVNIRRGVGVGAVQHVEGVAQLEIVAPGEPGLVDQRAIRPELFHQDEIRDVRAGVGVYSFHRTVTVALLDRLPAGIGGRSQLRFTLATRMA